MHRIGDPQARFENVQGGDADQRVARRLRLLEHRFVRPHGGRGDVGHAVPAARELGGELIDQDLDPPNVWNRVVADKKYLHLCDPAP